MTAYVDPDAVWTRWVDTACWPQDDPDTRAAGYDAPPADAAGPSTGPGDRPTAPAGTSSAGGDHGSPRPGTTGWIKPAKGPMSHFTVIRADRDAGRFDLQTRFPGATMHVEHRLSPVATGAGEPGDGSGAPGGTAPPRGASDAAGTSDPDAADRAVGAPAYELVHRIRISGPAAAVWGPVVGRGIVAGLPRVMAAIVERAGSGVPH